MTRTAPDLLLLALPDAAEAEMVASILATAGIAVRRAVSVAAARDAYQDGAFLAVVCD